jgi:hypothetical protein
MTTPSLPSQLDSRSIVDRSRQAARYDGPGAEPGCPEHGNGLVIRDLLVAIAWQDSLLQAYRGFQVTLQGALGAVGVGLAVVTIGFEEPIHKWLTATLLWITGAVALLNLFALHRAIRSRGQDVYYWQRELLAAESGAQGSFLRFKMHQVQRKQGGPPPGPTVGRPLAPEEVADLVTESDGGMRGTVDHAIFGGFVVLWLTLGSISLWTITASVLGY